MDSCRVSSRAAAPCSSRYDSRAAISMPDRRRFGIGTLLYFANRAVAIGSPSARKQVLALVGHAAQRNLRIALHRVTARPPKEIADRRGQKLGVVDGGVAHPLAARLVADHEAGAVPVSRQRVAATRQPQLFGDAFDVVLLAGEKQPAGSDMKLLGIGLEHGGRVPLGIDADRVEEEVFADAVAEQLLDLDQPRRLERALILAAGVDEVDRYLLALEQIVVDENGRPVLRDQRHVRKIVGTPGAG